MPSPRTGFALGCGALLALALLAVGLQALRTARLTDHARNARHSLEERLGDESAYTPPVGPPIEAHRLERFVAVREAIMDSCDDVAAMHGGMGGRPRGEGSDLKSALTAFWRNLRTASVSPVVMGGFAGNRAHALFAESMGVGEYVWIYALTYYGALGEEPRLGARPGLPGAVPAGARTALLRMLDDYVSGLRQAGLADDADAWATELRLLEADPRRRPFADGPPVGLVECVAPFRDRLAPLFCAATDPMELMRLRRFGLGFSD